MADRIYLGTILDQNNKYFKAVVEVDKIDKTDFLISDNTSSSTAVDGILVDGDYLYRGRKDASLEFNLERLNKDDLTVVAESNVSAWGTVTTILSDANYIYTLSSINSASVVTKWSKTNLSKVSDFEISATSMKMVMDNNWIFLNGDNNTVWKLNKTTLSKVAESSVYGSSYLHGMTIDDTFVYIIGSFRTIRKLDKTTLSDVAETNQFAGNVDTSNIISDDDFLYACGLYNTVYKISKATMERVGQRGISSQARALAQDDVYIYVGGTDSNQRRVKKIEKDTFLLVLESAGQANLKEFSVDDEYIYSTTGIGNTIVKVSKLIEYYGGEGIADLMAYELHDVLYQIVGYRRA